MMPKTGDLLLEVESRWDRVMERQRSNNGLKHTIGRAIQMIKVLLIEDDADLSYTVAYALKKENLEIQVAESLAKAYESVKQNKYDMILLDVMLPDGTGYEFCEAVRKTSDVPIIFLTACDDEAKIVTGLDIGGDDYITKPFRIRELISRINAVLRRKGMNKDNEESTGVLNSGDIKVSTNECRVFVDDLEVSLTATEYKLLLAFMTSPHQLLSRNKLLENLWDVDEKFVDDNALSVYVKRLREKININNAEYIVTIRGLGYKWNKDVRRR